MFIPDPNIFHPGSRKIPDPESASKNLSIFNPKYCFYARKYDPECSSWIRIPDPEIDFLPIPDSGSPIPDPGVKMAPDPGYRIRIGNTASLYQIPD
jgi:hypothetical protein